MDSDWSVSCAADDPVIVVPWASEDKSIHYIDLRVDPDRVWEIPEAVQYPCMSAALLLWNRSDSSIYTAKSDVWSYAANQFDAEDLPGFAYAHACYIDLIPREPDVFSNFAAGEQNLRTWTRVAHRIAAADARCEWTLRPARILQACGEELGGSANNASDGFATTLYVWGYGSSPQAAMSAWSDAMVVLIEPVLLF